MKIIIDRIENGMAVVEMPDCTHIDVPAVLFENVSEGKAYEINETENELNKKIAKLIDEVWDD